MDPEIVRGIPYVPLAIITEEPLGMGLGWWYDSLAWDVFPLSPQEVRTSEWLEELWPQSFHVQNEENTATSESFYMVGGPLGDVADILLPQNLSTTTLTDAYRAVVVAGLGNGVTPSLAHA